MASNNPIVSQLAREALKAFPKQATNAIARGLFAKFPGVFHSVEHARTAVRRHRGAQGANGAKNPVAKRTKAESTQARDWASLLPKPQEAGWKWHELPTDVSRWLILADLHVPYHDVEFLRTALAHADGNCDGVLLLGDVLDCYQASSFCKDPRKVPIAREIDDARRLLDALALIDGVKRIVYKGGNHELRLEHYIWQHAPAICDVPGVTLQSWCELERRGVVWIPCQEPIRHHQLAILHGHEQGNRFSSPVNPARGLFLRMIECCLAGHEHRSSSHTETTLLGTVIATWSVGCGCNLHPEYRPLGHKWNHGFTYLRSGSEWEIENWKILDGKPKLC